MTHTIPIITIDGPSGSGKGTIGQLLAQKLGWHFLDSGALYRTLAFAALQQGITPENEAALITLAEQFDVEFKINLPGQSTHILLQGVDVTREIRSETCGVAASKIAALAPIRQRLLARQRQFKVPPGLVADGRDMGSVIFPEAPLKIFLIATPEERALRRYRQLKERGINVSLDALCEELIARDRRDEQRSVAPLKPASDAVILDTTGLSIEEVLRRVDEKVQNTKFDQTKEGT